MPPVRYRNNAMKYNRPTKMSRLRGDHPFAQFMLNEAKRPGHLGSDARLLVSRFQGRTESGLRGEIEHTVDDLVERGEWLDRLLRVRQIYHLRCECGAPDEYPPELWEPLSGGGYKRRELQCPA